MIGSQNPASRGGLCFVGGAEKTLNQNLARNSGIIYRLILVDSGGCIARRSILNKYYILLYLNCADGGNELVGVIRS